MLKSGCHKAYKGSAEGDSQNSHLPIASARSYRRAIAGSKPSLQAKPFNPLTKTSLKYSNRRRRTKQQIAQHNQAFESLRMHLTLKFLFCSSIRGSTEGTARHINRFSHFSCYSKYTTSKFWPQIKTIYLFLQKNYSVFLRLAPVIF